MTAVTPPIDEPLIVQLAPDNFEFDPDGDLGLEYERTPREFYVGHFTGAAPNAVPVGRSRFPWPVENGYHFFTDDELKAALDHLVRNHGPGGTDYDFDNRGIFCGINLELNNRHRWAPRFRSLPPLPLKPTTAQEKQFLVDMQVLDLHWRACSPNRPSGKVTGYPGLFDGGRWCVSSAVALAERELPFKMKCRDAHLMPTMLVEHAALQTPEIRDEWRILQAGRVRGSSIDQWGAPQLEAFLHEQMRAQPNLRQHIPGLVMTWQAYRLVGRHPRLIARLVGLMNGTPPVDESAIRKKLSTLERRTGWTLD